MPDPRPLSRDSSPLEPGRSGGERPVIAVRLVLPDGSLIERAWGMSSPDLGRVADRFKSPPAWLKNPKKKWDHPQDPIMFTGQVRAGHEADARALVGEGADA